MGKALTGWTALLLPVAAMAQDAAPAGGNAQGDLSVTMKSWLAALVVLLSLTAAPALAAPCKTQGTIDAPIAFPRNDANDVPLARSLIPVMLPDVTAALPRALSCNRATVSTALGPYLIGGENEERFSRVAMPADGGDGPVAYLATTPEAAGIFALVIHPQGALTIVKRLYAGVPTDQRLAVDLVAALADNKGIMAADPARKSVTLAFLQPGAAPPPVQSGPRPGGTAVIAGPQVLVLSSGDPKLLEQAGDTMRHRPSGFACPSTFTGLPVLLMTVDPRIDYLSCSYRAGTDPAFQKDAPIKYQVNLSKPSQGETTQSIFDQLTASARKAFRLKGDHKPPLATGRPPAPEFVACWDTEEGDVQGVWVGKAGGWLIWLRAQYPLGAANDVEAGKVAQILFTQIGQQVK